MIVVEILRYTCLIVSVVVLFVGLLFLIKGTYEYHKIDKEYRNQEAEHFKEQETKRKLYEKETKQIFREIVLLRMCLYETHNIIAVHCPAIIEE